MRCQICARKFRDGEQVLPVQTYVVNERRGDFVGNQPETFVHLAHLTAVS
jgi:hypothetical protein